VFTHIALGPNPYSSRMFAGGLTKKFALG